MTAQLGLQRLRLLLMVLVKMCQTVSGRCGRSAATGLVNRRDVAALRQRTVRLLGTVVVCGTARDGDGQRGRLRGRAAVQRGRRRRFAADGSMTVRPAIDARQGAARTARCCGRGRPTQNAMVVPGRRCRRRQRCRRHLATDRAVDDRRRHIAVLVVGLLVAVYVDVNGQDAGHLGTDERRDRHEERRAVPVEELGLVHRRRLRLVVGRFARHGAHVDDDADQGDET